ncbi:MAG: hypothetical protein M3O34_00215 [Chloroflexota bacterium]|nr:hypothetical protein [Chloroflexota bacterium]
MNQAGEPFGEAGLVAMSVCGHWWTYPWRMTLGQLHEVVAFHGITVCPFCESARDGRGSTAARPTIGRLN